MISCQEIMELLVLEAEGELDFAQAVAVQEHLKSCEACSRESDGIRAIREMLQEPGLFAPEEDRAWDSLPTRCVLEAAKIRPFRPVRFALRWALPLAACVVLGLGFAWMMRRPGHPVETASAPPAGNAAFLEKIDQELATSATARYLAECQELLVDMLKASRSCKGKGYDMSQEIVRARELLQARRILEAESDSPEVARAKDLCEDLDAVMLSLSLSQDCESPDKYRWIEGVVEKERLLLRIRLLQSEIS
jgi:hypothetical protein